MAKTQHTRRSAVRGLPKCPTGIQGLDEITGGGLPRGRPTLVCGAAGCGKTLLAMQFLVRGATDGSIPDYQLAAWLMAVRLRGMTDAETRQTAELLREINRDRTVVVVEHDMAFVRELGVKVTCLHEGSVLAEGTIDQVSQNQRVVEVYLGR